MFKEVTVEEALELTDTVLIDVRSESEYAEATIPGAINVPLLNDWQRAAVGTVYHREGEARARRLGLEVVAPELVKKVTLVDNLASGKKVVVFCWRGGERSNFMASVLSVMGHDVYRIKGGFKAYRRYVTSFLNRDELTQKAVVVYGLTGSGKTDVLNLLAKRGVPVLDLEGLAAHRGSVYGKIGMPSSPTQKAFENEIVEFFRKIGDDAVFLVECESRRIGNLLVPAALMNTMKKGYRVLLYTSLENRVKRIKEVYTSGPGYNINELISATQLLEKRIGKAKVKELVELLLEHQFDLVFSFLLTNYYDPLYNYPSGPSEDYHLCVESSNVEKAAGEVFKFVTGLKSSLEGER